MWLAVATLALSAACRADDATPAIDPAAPTPAATDAASQLQPAPEGATTARVYRHGPSRHLTAAQGIDEGVHRLARALDLDPGQQERLRQILVDQHRKIMQLRSGRTAASGDMTSAMLAIYEQSRTRIRSMLSEQQRLKYPAEVPQGQTAPAQADLQHWLKIQEDGRKQGSSASQ
jgi:small-conductance mechanosensitive channel